MKIAVVGAGVSGLSAAWLLSSKHDVTLFEAEHRLGGHANTVDVTADDGPCPIDTGFIVYNLASYPNLIALFDHLKVPTAPTEMSFSVSLDGGQFEYSGNGLRGLFAQRTNLFSPRHWTMVLNILRFFKEAGALDPATAEPGITLRQWLNERNYREAFVRHHILPMAAAIWSTPADEILKFPVAAFVRFFANHGLLQVADRPQWRTVNGGSREYVSRLAAATRAEVVTGDAIVSLSRAGGINTLRLASGREEDFQACVLATHADEALALLDDADDMERNLLSPFRYTPNEAVLHTDASLMPRRRNVWTSWNYLGNSAGKALCVTYWMNKLQPLPTTRDHFVTLNPCTPIDNTAIIKRFEYAHPLFDAAAMRAQVDLWSLQGRHNTWFAGSYFGYGFHEDGLQAGLAVAEDLGGVCRPWRVEDARGRILSPAAQGHADVSKAA